MVVLYFDVPYSKNISQKYVCFFLANVIHKEHKNNGHLLKCRVEC